MKIKAFTENGRIPVTVLQVDGNLDSSTHEQFRVVANEALKTGSRYILLDLSQTRFISSAGFRAFNDLFNQLRALHPESYMSEEKLNQVIHEGAYKSPHLKLLNLSEEAYSTFELAGFHMFIETFTNLQTALASF